jgi:hypothetical protein
MEGKERMAFAADEDVVVVGAADTADAVKEEVEASRGEVAEEEEREMLPAGYWWRTSGPRSGWKRA